MNLRHDIEQEWERWNNKRDAILSKHNVTAFEDLTDPLDIDLYSYYTGLRNEIRGYLHQLESLENSFYRYKANNLG